MKSIPAQHRPNYLPTEQLAILELLGIVGEVQCELLHHPVPLTDMMAGFRQKVVCVDSASP